jgi:hypothetical protein
MNNAASDINEVLNVIPPVTRIKQEFTRDRQLFKTFNQRISSAQGQTRGSLANYPVP